MREKEPGTCWLAMPKLFFNGMLKRRREGLKMGEIPLAQELAIAWLPLDSTRRRSNTSPTPSETTQGSISKNVMVSGPR